MKQNDLTSRLTGGKKSRENSEVEIVSYTPEYRLLFKQFNEEWISKYFKMEEADYKALDHPQEYILDKGGHILFALYQGNPVGTCALIKTDDHSFELAKMAVSGDAKGKGIGYLLASAAIQKARDLGARKIYLESNTRLKPAISLYHKLGFREINGKASPYERVDIQMELII